MHYIGHHYPTPKQLRNILKPDVSGVATRWYDLGVQLLDDAATGVLDVIKADHPNDVTTCCNEMFKKWLEMQHDASWSQLVMALNKIGLNAVADNINKLIKNGEQHLAIFVLNSSKKHPIFINSYKVCTYIGVGRSIDLGWGALGQRTQLTCNS